MLYWSGVEPSGDEFVEITALSAAEHIVLSYFEGEIERFAALIGTGEIEPERDVISVDDAEMPRDIVRKRSLVNRIIAVRHTNLDPSQRLGGVESLPDEGIFDIESAVLEGCDGHGVVLDDVLRLGGIEDRKEDGSNLQEYAEDESDRISLGEGAVLFYLFGRILFAHFAASFPFLKGQESASASVILRSVRHLS